MIDRENLGVVDSNWPTLSVPCPVEDHFCKLTKQLPPEVETRIVGTGYHNQGWSYREVEVRAPTWSRAVEEAERLCAEVMWEFQWRKMNDA